MRTGVEKLAVWLGLGAALGAAGIGFGCDGAAAGDDDASAGDEAIAPAALAALMEDGDPATLAPGAMVRPAPMPQTPPRFCPGGDCARAPLAQWTFDDCNAQTTLLADTANGFFNQHPAFRAVSAACVAGASGQGVRLDEDDDVVYAPDQPDFNFGAGLTVAMWVNPDRVTGTQSLARKRLDGNSSFVLAIDGRRVVFALRLAGGRLVAVTAPVQARRFTHVAATYDGRDAILYVDGTAAARARAAGSIAAGAGPIFVGNDANGRRLDGVVDEVWLNTLAAPADVIRGLTCVRRPPVVTLSPAASPPQVAGSAFPFDLSVTNPSSATCPADVFFYGTGTSTPLSSDTPFGQVTAGPGQTAHASVLVRSARNAFPGSYPFEVFVANVSSSASVSQTIATASYVVGTGPVACEGFRPGSPAIIGPGGGAAGAPYTFAATGLVAPVVTPVFAGPFGGIQSLQASIAPGVPTDANAAFLGFGAGFANPPCLDASAYTGVRFTLSGDLGTCQARFSVIVSQDNAVGNGPFGACTADACVPPMSQPITTGTQVVRFADMTGGQPLATVDPTALNGVQWTFAAPTDGVTAPCVANVTVTDVQFVTDAGPGPGTGAVNYTFDASAQGWHLNTFDDPNRTNLAARPGASPPSLSFNPMVGDPAPGAVVVSAPFTAFDQYVDAIVDTNPAIDLTGRTLHARVRLVSGSFPTGGGLQLHALSTDGTSFAFAGNFVSGTAFAPFQWVPLDLDLGAIVPPGFDPRQVIQLGVQFYAGAPIPGLPFDGPTGGAVFELDTVTD